jgi:hypothetical protein
MPSLTTLIANSFLVVLLLAFQSLKRLVEKNPPGRLRGIFQTLSERLQQLILFQFVVKRFAVDVEQFGGF